MRFSSLSLLLLPVLAIAEPGLAHDYSSATQQTTSVAKTTRTTTSLASTAQQALSSTPQPTTSTMSPHDYDRLPHALKQFILDMSPRSKIEGRQQAAGGGGGVAGGGIAPGGGVPAQASPTQLSPVTVYNIGQGDMTYTQLFSSPPDQWPTPSSGSIGMGTIVGTPGLVKSYSGNPAPTQAPRAELIAAAAIIGMAMV